MISISQKKSKNIEPKDNIQHSQNIAQKISEVTKMPQLELYAYKFETPQFDPYSEWSIPEYSTKIEFRGYVDMKGLYRDYQTDDEGAGWAKSPLELDFIRDGLRFNVHRLWNRPLNENIIIESNELFSSLIQKSKKLCQNQRVEYVTKLSGEKINQIRVITGNYSETISKDGTKDSRALENWKIASNKVDSWAESETRAYIAPRDIINLHKLICHEIPLKEGNAGEYREKYAFAGQASAGQYFLAHQDIRREIDYFCDWLNTGLKDIYEGKSNNEFYSNPIILGSKAYERFISIHPFLDGNGRVGRCILNFVMEKFNLLPPVLSKDDPASVGGVSGMIPYKIKNQNDVIKAVMNGLKDSYSTIENH